MKKWLWFGAGLLIGASVSRISPKRDKGEVTIGLPDEWKRFADRNPHFIASLPLLFDTMESVFNRSVTLPSLADEIVYFLSKIAGEDFMEIFMLCGNGHGIGGLKILRGMYERVVTLAYIAKNPTEADAFWNYYSIHK
jgi:hypothetical protein